MFLIRKKRLSEKIGDAGFRAVATLGGGSAGGLLGYGGAAWSKYQSDALVAIMPELKNADIATVYFASGSFGEENNIFNTYLTYQLFQNYPTQTTAAMVILGAVIVGAMAYKFSE